jgi:sulfite reductase (NADPH) flavoprotein alpha-component
VTSDPIRWLWAAALVGAWLLLALGIALIRRRRAQPVSASADAVLIAFASQTGFGESLAQMTARALTEAGLAVRLVSFSELDLQALTTARRALFIVSTTGEGDPPDSAARAVRRMLSEPAKLDGLFYGLLALGDRSYRDFCAFGHALEGWLDRSGAARLFDTVEVDDGEAGAIRHWQTQLGQITGHAAAPDWAPPAYDRWRLVERALVNPGSPGGQAWRLAFEPVGAAPDWSAGDIVEVGAPAQPGEPAPAHREYSAASLPDDGRLELLVRLMSRPDGSPGLASGWLTGRLEIGGEAMIRLRTNRAFHGPSPQTPMILIGNGTGIAGLRAHLKAREAAVATGGAWLMFGERTRAHDAFYDDDLQAWLAAGVLTRSDRTFSRDPEGGYVQDTITRHAQEVRDWVARGAAVYVCGSLQGMAPGVHAALEAALGAPRVAELLETGRYRRDVY